MALIAAGPTVRGLVRNKANAEVVAAYGIEAVIGSLDDAAVLQPKDGKTDGDEPV
jgi:uncharacterized protein YbjT (DUF2867 family)